MADKEIRFRPTEDEKATLQAMTDECGFTTLTAAIRYLIKFHGEAEVQRKRLLQQGIYPAAAPIQAGIYPPTSPPDTPTPPQPHKGQVSQRQTPLPPAPPKTDAASAMNTLMMRRSA